MSTLAEEMGSLTTWMHQALERSAATTVVVFEASTQITLSIGADFDPETLREPLALCLRSSAPLASGLGLLSASEEHLEAILHPVTFDHSLAVLFDLVPASEFSSRSLLTRSLAEELGLILPSPPEPPPNRTQAAAVSGARLRQMMKIYEPGS